MQKWQKIGSFGPKMAEKFFFQKTPHHFCRSPQDTSLVQISAQNLETFSNYGVTCKKIRCQKMLKTSKDSFFQQFLTKKLTKIVTIIKLLIKINHSDSKDLVKHFSGSFDC